MTFTSNKKGLTARTAVLQILQAQEQGVAVSTSCLANRLGMSEQEISDILSHTTSRGYTERARYTETSYILTDRGRDHLIRLRSLPTDPGDPFPVPRKIGRVTVREPGQRVASELRAGDVLTIFPHGTPSTVTAVTDSEAPGFLIIETDAGLSREFAVDEVLTVLSPADRTSPDDVLPPKPTHADHLATRPTHTGQTTLVLPADASLRERTLFSRAARELFNAHLVAQRRPAFPVALWFDDPSPDTHPDQRLYVTGELASWEQTVSTSGRLTFTDGTVLFDGLLLRVTF